MNMIKKKLNKDINNGSKLKLKYTDSSFYPQKDNCESYQNVWITEEELIRIDYSNVEKWKNSKENHTYIRKRYPNYDGDILIFQGVNDENPTEILIRFRYKNIIQAVEILICYTHYSVSYREDFMVKFNNQPLEIYVPDRVTDREEDSLGGYNIMIEEHEFVEKIIKNISEENTISIIIGELGDFSATSSLWFTYESYDHDENYLGEREYQRLEKIKTSWLYKARNKK